MLRQLAITILKGPGLRPLYTLGPKPAFQNPKHVRLRSSRRWIVTTSSLSKRRKDSNAVAVTSEDQKKKSRAACVTIWKNMTVEDLAGSLEKPIGGYN